MRLGRDSSPTFANTYITNVITASTSVFSKTCEVAAGLNVLRVTGLQTDATALTGTLRGAYIDVSNGALDATGTIRAMELKARTEAPGDTGNDVAVLEGLSISADSKGHGVTTMRAAEFILDGTLGGTIDEAVGLRIANNLQANKATLSYGLQIYRDSFDYTYDIVLSLGGHITGDSYVNQDLRTTASPTHVGLDLTGILTVDTINEHTGAAGVTIEGILIKDSDVHLQDYDAIFFGDAQDAYIYFDETRLLINSISEVWIGATYNKSLVAGNLFSNGNMNIGYTAMRHTWKDYYDVLEIGGTGALFCNTTVLANMSIGISQNAYFDETDERWEYAVADEASLYTQVYGGHKFYVNAGAGAAAGGPITFVNALDIADDATITCEGASVTIGKASTTTGTIVLHDSGSANTITLTVPNALAASLSFTLPPTDGDNTNVLQTDGNGVLTWVAAGGGGTWIGLTDTDPANYTGQAGNTVVVNAGEDGLEFGAAPGGAFTSKCSVYRNATQAITTGTWTKIQLNTEDYDADGEFDNAVNYRFQPDTTGYYIVSACVSMTDLGAGKYINCGIYKNGALWKIATVVSHVGTQDPRVCAGCDMYLLNTDYIELYVYHNHGSNRNIEGTGRYTFMDVHRFA